MSETLSVCGLTIERGKKLRTLLPVPDTAVQIPLTIINGAEDGPTLLITAGIHGGEYPGIAAAMELGKDITPEEVKGSLIIMHPVNVQGFWARREFIVPEDGKNLNRVFPGDPLGTLADKTAYLISSNFFPLADFFVDMHSGDIHESLHPYVYYPGQPTPEIEKQSRSVAKVLDMEYMVRSLATGGAYNYAASQGLPSILIERGGAGLCLQEDIEAYKEDICNIMRKLKMFATPVRPRHHHPRDVENLIYLEAEATGCWRHHIHSGDFVYEGQVLGRITDLFGETITTYYAEQTGVVLYVCPALSAPKGTVLVAYGTIREDEE
ncbi:MAG: succinylglutamate desuccinylase/aspartoacylase family protein [Phascolarctobacterium sp.]|nr:succinylglutamate desuccinylase/aspartoacylase family protein [Phascolarctobacterium sp.]MBQ7760394.1 succinylglutamate desuccinylase/aspartoacylase family protein [Acidaminococcaceae bacterium]MBQ7883974.1 succinylglutamate desuccinylase/aspartoacylase family protein [Phascolarctobacterium sp.]